MKTCIQCGSEYRQTSIACHKKTDSYGWRGYWKVIARKRLALIDAQPSLFEQKPEQTELPL